MMILTIPKLSGVLLCAKNKKEKINKVFIFPPSLHHLLVMFVNLNERSYNFLFSFHLF